MCVSAIAAVGAGIAAGGTVYSIDQQRSAAKKQRRANQVQRNVQDVQLKEQRQQSERERRIRRARVLNAAAASGAGESSAIIGASGAADSLFLSGMAFQDTQGMAADEISRLQQDAQQNAFNAQLGQLGAQIGGSMFGNTDAWQRLF